MFQACGFSEMLAVMANEAANKIDYVEFQARDVAATKKFFAQLFSWKFTDYGPDYTSFEDGRIAGGLSRADKPRLSRAAAC
jgi:predicted enzyme related to lactoylglutathione lyase